ncbi:hemolysin III [Enteropsectra breve]|nr:hemolysin III [Enteropsectra breve]
MEQIKQTTKPLLRGVIHAIAFICTVVGAVAFGILSFFKDFNLGLLIYIASQLLQYGFSSFYHIPKWSPRVKKVLQHIDHICIFIMISGTQTSVLLNTRIIQKNPLSKLILKLSWTISCVGIIKILVTNKLHNIFDLVLYMIHGSIVIPFCKVLNEMLLLDRLLVILGGVFYLLGGVVFGLEKPNPVPKIFEYHELFHLLTVLANICFAIIITKPYMVSILRRAD